MRQKSVYISLVHEEVGVRNGEVHRHGELLVYALNWNVFVTNTKRHFSYVFPQ